MFRVKVPWRQTPSDTQINLKQNTGSHLHILFDPHTFRTLALEDTDKNKLPLPQVPNNTTDFFDRLVHGGRQMHVAPRGIGMHVLAVGVMRERSSSRTPCQASSYIISSAQLPSRLPLPHTRMSSFYSARGSYELRYGCTSLWHFSSLTIFCLP